MSTLVPPRTLPLDGVYNFRDLGGYPTVDGRTTRWRVLYRADGLGRLTADDLEKVRATGLRTVIDLRSQFELDERGRFPHEDHPVAFHHLSVLDQTWDREQALRENLPAVEFLHRAYRAMLVDGADRFAKAFEIVAAPGAMPAVFHCAAGKDRTGLLAALILGAVGVEHEAIVDDYAMTEPAMRAFLDTMREDPEIAARIDSSPPSFFRADPEAMRRVLADVTAEHGTVRDYVVGTGVEPSTIDRVADALLTD